MVSHNHNQELFILLRLEAATQCLVYAQDNKPGEDLGQEAIAACFLEIRKCLKELEELRGNSFDSKASLAELMNSASKG